MLAVLALSSLLWLALYLFVIGVLAVAAIRLMSLTGLARNAVIFLAILLSLIVVVWFFGLDSGPAPAARDRVVVSLASIRVSH